MDHTPVKLRAVDAADLEIMAAVVQDALVPLSDMLFIQEERRFVLALNRFVWESTSGGSADETYRRSHGLLSILNVDGVQTRGIDRSDPDRFLNLLGITYDQNAVMLSFSDGGDLRLRVSALDCLFEDVGEAWPTQWRPDHDAE